MAMVFIYSVYFFNINYLPVYLFLFSFVTQLNILGSYAHCVTNSPAGKPPVCGNKVYGAGTWTNGQVAVSYLSSYLSMSLTVDFAYGHAWGS